MTAEAVLALPQKEQAAVVIGQDLTIALAGPAIAWTGKPAVVVACTDDTATSKPQLAGSSGPEQERLLYEMHCALNLATNNVIHHPDFIEHPSASGATRPQQPGETLPLMFR